MFKLTILLFAIFVIVNAGFSYEPRLNRTIANIGRKITTRDFSGSIAYGQFTVDGSGILCPITPLSDLSSIGVHVFAAAFGENAQCFSEYSTNDVYVPYFCLQISASSVQIVFGYPTTNGIVLKLTGSNTIDETLFLPTGSATPGPGTFQWIAVGNAQKVSCTCATQGPQSATATYSCTGCTAADFCSSSTSASCTQSCGYSSPTGGSLTPCTSSSSCDSTYYNTALAEASTPSLVASDPTTVTLSCPGDTSLTATLSPTTLSDSSDFTYAFVPVTSTFPSDPAIGNCGPKGKCCSGASFPGDGGSF